MLTFKDSFVVCVILNKVKNLKIYQILRYAQYDKYTRFDNYIVVK